MISSSDDAIIRSLGAVVGIWAHPDDETYLSAGVMAAAARLGSRVACVTATRGEQGSLDPARWPPSRLAEIRTAELDAALEIIGVAEHHWLDLPDGGCASVPAAAAVTRLTELIDQLRPDTILTFGPDGMTGHPDHRAVSGWVSAAAAAGSTMPRVLHATTTPQWRDEMLPDLEGLDVFAPGTPAVTPAAELALHLELSGDALERKFAALCAQPSQTDLLRAALGDDRYRRQLATEMFCDAR
jgi:LmbE family N-acetylglucosaminyl deacetylase